MSDAAVITLAIPYYAGHAYLRRAVEAVLGQTDGRWNLVICDDGGDPAGGVAELLAGYGDRRIRYLPPTGVPGMAANWNRCLSVADTDLVALPHADDELGPGYVGGMLAAAAAHPDAAVLFCAAKIIDADGRERFSAPDFVKRFLRPSRGRVVTLAGEAGLRAVMRGNFVMCPTMGFRRSRLGLRRFDARWRQVLDLDLIARLLLSGESLVGVPEVLYAYRRHSENATTEQTRTLLRFREERALFDEVAAAATGQGWHRAAAVAQAGTVIRLNLGFCTLTDVARGRWADAGRKLRLLADVRGGSQE